MLPLHIIDYLSCLFKTSVNTSNIFQITGGCINQAFRLTLKDKRNYFGKINSSTAFPDLFVKEKNGLELLNKHQVIRTPAIIDVSVVEADQIIILEWIPTGTPTKDFWKVFGERLANLHQISADDFGLNEDNYMGSVPQSNSFKKTWPDFFMYNRLQPLVKQCCEKNLLPVNDAQRFERLYPHLNSIFSDNRPALVHGDLWSGNFMCDENSLPVLIDPAAYYGHTSVDLGMTTLFGKFNAEFYTAYNYELPFPPNYKEQWQISNLYPLLIHLLLFGRSYLSQIQQTLKQFS
jgi:fructosamine-3-kinase